MRDAIHDVIRAAQLNAEVETAQRQMEDMQRPIEQAASAEQERQAQITELEQKLANAPMTTTPWYKQRMVHVIMLFAFGMTALASFFGYQLTATRLIIRDTEVLRAGLQQSNDRISELEQRLSAAQQDAAATEGEIARLDSRLEATQQDAAAAEVEIAELQSRLDAETNNAAEARAEAADLRAQLDELRAPAVVATATSFTDCPICPEMGALPADSFEMGSPPSEVGRDNDEGPQHDVRVPAFAIGKYEVTFAEWDACVADGACEQRPEDRGWGRGDLPVINVSWEDTQQYVDWLSGQTGKTYRLPSEAEWEYAARAGTTTPFHFGGTISTAQANYDGSYTYAGGAEGEYRRRPVPVGSFPPNAFGLHDVHGNVWEWVQDCWNNNYEGAPPDGRPWEIGDCNTRVLRGGSWIYRPEGLRSASRVRLSSDNRGNTAGFRVARTLD